MGIATAIIAIGLALTAAVGPEKKGSNFEIVAPATEDVHGAGPVQRGTWQEEAKEDDASMDKKSIDGKPEVRNHVA